MHMNNKDRYFKYIDYGEGHYIIYRLSGNKILIRNNLGNWEDSIYYKSGVNYFLKDKGLIEMTEDEAFIELI